MPQIPLWKACFLGALQGLTEFLPVSSSAHLVIAQQFFGMGKNGEVLLTFDVILHLGTLLAVLLFFARDLIWMIKEGKGRRLAFLLVIATLPAVVIGLGFKKEIESLFTSATVAAGFLIVTGFLLWTTQWARSGNTPLEAVTPKQAVGVGLSQAFAIFPGISRSGSTIASGLFLGLTPEAAVRFSFLLSIIAIAGANVLEIGSFKNGAEIFCLPSLVGLLVSFIFGLAAIRWMIGIVKRQKLYYFSWYCWLVGTVVIFLSH